MKVTLSILNKLLQAVGFQVTCNNQSTNDILLVDILLKPTSTIIIAPTPKPKPKKKVTLEGLRANYKWN